MWQLDFLVFVLAIILAAAIGRVQQWPIGFSIWLGVVLQPVGCLIARGLYLSTPLSPEGFSAARLLLAGVLPVASASALAALSGRPRRSHHNPRQHRRLRFGLFKLVAIQGIVVALFWYIYPLDFYSPHKFDLQIASLYDSSYLPSTFDASTVTNLRIAQTYLAMPVLGPKALPITALAAFLMFATAVLGVGIVARSLARDGGKNWYALDRQVRRSILFAGCATSLFSLIPFTLVAAGLVPEQMIPWKRVAGGVLFLTSVPGVVWALRRING